MSFRPAGDAVTWYHRNEDTVVPKTIEHQGLQAAADKVRNPLLHRTFGGMMAGPGFQAVGRTLACDAFANADVRSRDRRACQQKRSRHGFKRLKSIIGEPAEAEDDMGRTAAWWRAFWDRSWVFVSGDAVAGIPANKHPLRIGVDSGGQNLLPGFLGRINVFHHALSAEEIGTLAKIPLDKVPQRNEGLLYSRAVFKSRPSRTWRSPLISSTFPAA